MKALLLSAIVSLSLFALGGCGKSRASIAATAGPVPAATYKAGHGVQLTSVARDFSGVKTGGVAAHSFSGRPGVPAVPSGAVLRTIRGDFVYVANGEWFLRTPVTLGAVDATHVEIGEGLYEGDIVVVQGVPALALAEMQALNGGVGCADGH